MIDIMDRLYQLCDFLSYDQPEHFLNVSTKLMIPDRRTPSGQTDQKTDTTAGEEFIGEPEAIQEQIRTRAYQIWIEEDCPEGRAADNWARAESETLANSRQLRALLRSR